MVSRATFLAVTGAALVLMAFVVGAGGFGALPPLQVAQPAAQSTTNAILSLEFIAALLHGDRDS